MYGELYVRAESREQLAQYLAAWLLAVRRALGRRRRPVSPADPAPGAASDVVPPPIILVHPLGLRDGRPNMATRARCD